jgi:hypothetical protein
MQNKNESEILFEKYLDTNGYRDRWIYEPSILGKIKHPDYLLDYNNQKYFFEVKELREKPNKPTSSPFFNAYSSLRSEIDEARKKFKEFKEYSCSLVVYKIDDVRAILEPPYFVFGAMLGDCGVEWELNSNKTNNSFLDNGKMLHGKIDKKAQNTSINAIIVLEKISKRQSDTDERGCRVIVHKNPYAKFELSNDLFKSPFDEVLEWSNHKIKRVFVGNELINK